MIRASFRAEMRKMWNRPATWVTLGLFGLVTVANFLEEFLGARKDPADPFALPDAWSLVLGGDVLVGFVFASVLMILLVAAEFSWRTARQNVIDGLSKTQWYAAKLLLAPLLTAIFLAIRSGVGGGLAAAGTELSAGVVLLGPAQARALGGLFLAGLGYTTVALVVATAIRSSGPAMAVWFAWFAFGERLVAGGLGSLFEGLRPILRWLPMSTFSRLTNYMQYDPAALQRAVEQAVGQERPPLELPPLEPAILGALLWTGAFALIGWLWYRRRDL